MQHGCSLEQASTTVCTTTYVMALQIMSEKLDLPHKPFTYSLDESYQKRKRECSSSSSFKSYP